MGSGEKECLLRYSELTFIAADLAIDSIYTFHFMSAENICLFVFFHPPFSFLTVVEASLFIKGSIYLRRLHKRFISKFTEGFPDQQKITKMNVNNDNNNQINSDRNCCNMLKTNWVLCTSALVPGYVKLN